MSATVGSRLVGEQLLKREITNIVDIWFSSELRTVIPEVSEIS